MFIAKHTDYSDPLVQEAARAEAAELTRLIISHEIIQKKRRRESQLRQHQAGGSRKPSVQQDIQEGAAAVADRPFYYNCDFDEIRRKTSTKFPPQPH